MPIYRVKVDGNTQFKYSDKELATLTAKEGKEVEKDVLQLFEAQEIEELILKIEKLGEKIKKLEVQKKQLEAITKEKSRKERTRRLINSRVPCFSLMILCISFSVLCG